MHKTGRATDGASSPISLFRAGTTSWPSCTSMARCPTVIAEFAGELWGLRARLLNEARTSGRPFNELVQYYAVERFLFRLSQSPYVEQFVLKGALLLRTHDVAATRPTRDIDLLGRGPLSIDNLEDVVRECLTVEIDDGMVFDANTVRGSEIKKASRSRRRRPPRGSPRQASLCSRNCRMATRSHRTTRPIQPGHDDWLRAA
ncbi:MAG: hypothetical protein ACI9BV_003707 [Rhodothermales bacterium]|jgi:hypothetical protein